MAAKTTRKSQAHAKVGIVMGSQSDWETMQHTALQLNEFGVVHEVKIVSAHRTPERLFDYAKAAHGMGFQVLIAGAGGAAHLPGMLSSLTTLPVFGVPVESRSLNGLDSLLSIAQMPAGVPVGTLAIGRAGALNAALLAVAVLSLHDEALRKKWLAWREAQTKAIALKPKTKVSGKR